MRRKVIKWNSNETVIYLALLFNIIPWLRISYKISHCMNIVTLTPSNKKHGQRCYWIRHYLIIWLGLFNDYVIIIPSAQLISWLNNQNRNVKYLKAIQIFTLYKRVFNIFIRVVCSLGAYFWPIYQLCCYFDKLQKFFYMYNSRNLY